MDAPQPENVKSAGGATVTYTPGRFSAWGELDCSGCELNARANLTVVLQHAKTCRAADQG